MYQPTMSSARTILCFGAHSDDIEIGCGGTLLELLSHNPALDIHWIVLSGKGERADEARNSADRFLERGVGRHNVQICGFRDSYFPTQWELIKDYFHELSKVIQPDVVFTHRRDDAHQDHRVVSELTWSTFRNHLVLEYEIPKYEGDLGQPNVFVPISERYAQQKSDLLLECFASQRTKPWFDNETFESLLRIRGLESNSPSRRAEAFYSRKLCLSAAPVSPAVDGVESEKTGADHVHVD